MSFDLNRFPPGILVSHFDVPRPVNWQTQFGNDRPLHLEIGFGLGEFLVDRAADRPDENLVGIEQDWARLGKCLGKIASVRSGGQADFGKNIRLMRVDATVALQRLFSPGTLGQVTCLFPCPWPKKSHIKHRLFSGDFLRLLNSRMRMGAGVKIVTDWQAYAQWIVEENKDSGFIGKSRTITARYNTKFERKWLAEGRERFWELDLIKQADCPAPVIEDVEMRARFVKDFDPAFFRFEDIVGETSVIFKDFMFDPRQNRGMVRLIVAEPFLTQHVWIEIVRTRDQWCIAKADGHSALPTAGVALAIEKAGEAALRSVKKED